MKKLTTRWYYSLEELLELVNEEEGLNWEVFQDCITDQLLHEIGLGTILEGLIDNIRLASYHYLDDTESKKMFTSYLWPEFRNSIVLYVDTVTPPWEEPAEPEYDEVYAALQEEVTRWARWYKDSIERYSTLINAYKSIENKLLGKVTTTVDLSGSNSNENTQTNNDTPQSGGNYLGDPYVNSASHNEGITQVISNSTTATDLNTPIERLNEVREKLHNLYADWADEFARFVIYSAD